MSNTTTALQEEGYKLIQLHAHCPRVCRLPRQLWP